MGFHTADCRTGRSPFRRVLNKKAVSCIGIPHGRLLDRKESVPAAELLGRKVPLRVARLQAVRPEFIGARKLAARPHCSAIRFSGKGKATFPQGTWNSGGLVRLSCPTTALQELGHARALPWTRQRAAGPLDSLLLPPFYRHAPPDCISPALPNSGTHKAPAALRSRQGRLLWEVGWLQAGSGSRRDHRAAEPCDQARQLMAQPTR